MIRTLTCLAPLAFATAVSAQAAFTLPSIGFPSTNNIPIAVGQCRYQQWFSAAEWVTAQGIPGQVNSLTLQPGNQGTTTTLDIQIAMGHGAGSMLSGVFDSSIVSNNTVVFPRQTTTVTAGQPLRFNFSTNFIWNGRDAVVVEIRIFGNGAGGAFTHNNASTTTASSNTQRAYAIGNANAANPTSVQAGWGLFMDFTTIPGAQLEYGAGCPGEGGAVPVAVVTSGIPRPGQPWVHQVQQANSSRLCIWAIGSDDQMFSGSPLPLDLASLGAPGCFLLNNVEHTEFVISVGGGPGAGIGQLTVQIPPITPIIGQSWFTQWFVLDENSANGLVSASQGIWSIIAP